MNHVLLTCVGILLTGIAYTQTPSEPAASPVISIHVTEGNIKPAPPTTTDADPNTDIVVDPASLLPDLPAVPHVNATLIGGTIEKVDRLRDQIAINIFGGGRMKVLFDPRTQIYAGGKRATTADLREGERISLDTILDGNRVFARTIRVKAGYAVGESQGIVLSYREDRGELTVRDSISPSPLRVHLTSSTRLRQGDHTVSASTLAPGTLIGITFDSEGSRDVAREISILAQPGVRYNFTGTVAYLNLSTGLLVVNSPAAGTSYEIYLDSSKALDQNLHAGAQVTVGADFEDSRYVARTITAEPETK